MAVREYWDNGFNTLNKGCKETEELYLIQMRDGATIYFYIRSSIIIVVGHRARDETMSQQHNFRVQPAAESKIVNIYF